MKKRFIDVEPPSNTTMLLTVVCFVLLFLSLVTYVLGKADGRTDAMTACKISTSRTLEIWEITLEAAVLLDRVEREFGIVCKGGACTKNDPVTP